MAKVRRAARPAAKARRPLTKARIDTPLPSATSRRVVVKVRVVQVGAAWGRKAAQLHLSYLDRDGVERDGGRAELYRAAGAVDRAAFESGLPGEKHQFRLVLSPEDAHELDLTAYVRTYMARLEKDLGRRLEWAAVNHYNTDNPHAHVVIRGVDAEGREVRMAREYVAHGLRHRAEELATQELGPRPERSRQEQLRREVHAERYTSLDRALQRRAQDGLVLTGDARSRDVHYEAALRARLDVLERLGLATRERGAWRLVPGLRQELERMGRRAECLRVIAGVLSVSPAQCRIIDRGEPKKAQRVELERGVQGILQWKGLDEQGQFCAVIESAGGAVYHLPVSSRFAAEARVGQVVDLKRAVEKDAQIEAAARGQGWTYTPGGLRTGAREAFARRLEQLERMGLAQHLDDERWRLREDFRARVAEGKAQPYWQMLSLRSEPLRLEQQVVFPGPVWLDRVRRDELGAVGFGEKLRNCLRARDEYLRGLGLEPGSSRLRLQLEDLQLKRLAAARAAATGGRRVRAIDGFEGTVTVHRQPNGHRFVEVRAGERFVLRPAPRGSEALEGQRARLRLEQGVLRLAPLVERDRGQA